MQGLSLLMAMGRSGPAHLGTARLWLDRFLQPCAKDLEVSPQPGDSGRFLPFPPRCGTRAQRSQSPAWSLPPPPGWQELLRGGTWTGEARVGTKASRVPGRGFQALVISREEGTIIWGPSPPPVTAASRPWPWWDSSWGWHCFYAQVTGWTRPQSWKAVPRGGDSRSELSPYPRSLGAPSLAQDPG